jgi:hypothetical protein
MKTRREHLALLADAVVFANLEKGIGQAMDLHGFQSSFASGAQESEDPIYAPELIDRCLAHSVGTAVTNAYQRSMFNRAAAANHGRVGSLSPLMIIFSTSRLATLVDRLGDLATSCGMVSCVRSSPTAGRTPHRDTGSRGRTSTSRTSRAAGAGRDTHNGLVGGSSPAGPTTHSPICGDFLAARE